MYHWKVIVISCWLFDVSKGAVNITHPSENDNRAPNPLSEGAAAGTAVDTVTATGSGSLVYRIRTQTGVDALQINAGTGVITVVDSSTIDHESYPEYYVALNVSDESSSTLTTLIISLTDVNDCVPQFHSSLNNATIYIEHGSGQGAVLTDVLATDIDSTSPNNLVIDYQIASSRYTIDSTGHVTVATGQVANIASSPEQVVIKALDGGSPQLTGSVTVQVVVCSPCSGSESQVGQFMTSSFLVLLCIITSS